MTGAGFAIYGACVDFLLALARLTGMTYRDVNALFFFVAWPLVTLGLAAWCLVERALLRRAVVAAPRERSTMRYPRRR
jgi:hypothetical protein